MGLKRAPREPSAEERARAIAAVAERDPDADVVTRGAAEAWAEEDGDVRTVHLVALAAHERARGAQYVVWLVATRDGEVVDVRSVASRACGA